jgi:DsbC/DsbD-like thiol-disulfide interchange protein
MAGMSTILLAIAIATAAGAPLEDRRVTVSAEIAAAAPDSLVLLWSFDLADGWHLYGPHRNDTGQPPTVALDLPDGWRAGPLEGWPVPSRHVVADLILDHIYEERLVLRQTLHHPADPEAIEAAARVRWLVCAEMCVPGDTLLTVPLPGPIAGGADARLAQQRATAPAPLSLPYETDRRDDLLTITVPGARRLTLIPDTEGPGLADLIADGEVEGSTLRLRLDPDPADRAAFTGLLVIDHNNRQTAGTIVVP